MSKQLNIIISDEEFYALTELRKSHPEMPSVQGLARALFRQAVMAKGAAKTVSKLKIYRRNAPNQ